MIGQHPHHDPKTSLILTQQKTYARGDYKDVELPVRFYPGRARANSSRSIKTDSNLERAISERRHLLDPEFLRRLRLTEARRN